MADLERYFHDLVADRARGPIDRALLFVLKGLASPYASILRLRALAYRRGWLKTRRLPVPVISVGNITAGGTGKTPLTMEVARHFLKKGKRVAVLSRGYGGTNEGRVALVSDGEKILLTAKETGDEPYLMARKVPGLMVVIGADRYRAGMLAMERLKPDLFILDDGFQHLSLARDLNILLLDAGRPFSNGYTLPGGLLREPQCAAQRADLVVYTRCTESGVPHLFPEKGSVWTRHSLAGLVPLTGGAPLGMASAQGEKVAAFSGIANPGSFFELLNANGVRLAATLSFPDHAQYGEKEVAAIRRMREESGATLLITTEKDAVKLLAVQELLAPCCAVELRVVCTESAVFEGALEKVL